MPLGDVFIDVMRKAWDIREGRTRQNMSPKYVYSFDGQRVLMNRHSGKFYLQLGRSTTSIWIFGSRMHKSSSGICWMPCVWKSWT